MKTVLAFGDSLTWGKNPVTGGRHARADRWPNVLEAGLSGVEVISEGLRGRTTAFDQTTASCEMNGAKDLPMLLHSHVPLDLVIVMLGLNDLYWGHSPQDVTAGLECIVEVIRHHPSRQPEPYAPKILLVAQPPMVAGSPNPRITDTAVQASYKLADAVHSAAEAAGVPFVDMQPVATASPLDGIHLDDVNTRAMGKALITPVEAFLEG